MAGVTRQTIYRWIEQGLILPFWVGGHPNFLRQELHIVNTRIKRVAKAGEPVRQSYQLQAVTSGGLSQVIINRHADGSVDYIPNNLTDEWEDIRQEVDPLLRRNDPGDREDVIALLKSRFGQVFETSI